MSLLTWCYRRRWYAELGIKIHRSSRFIASRDTGYSTPFETPVTHRNESSNSTEETGDIGSKKKDLRELPSAYDPKYVESGWYDWWVSQGFFQPAQQENAEEKKLYSMVLPPPNVTGTLHLGHALTNSIQDTLIRWNRMHGKSVVWVPGSDHAGIATQVVVEKKLWRENKLTRHDVGRDKFIQEVWKWKKQKGNIIADQMKRLGSSLDWSRECFTMDEKLSKAVVEAFVRLHDEGLIYRSNRLVNWSCTLQSAISDIEVENVNIEGKTKVIVPGYDRPVRFGTMTIFQYPVENSDEKVPVSTTRPETMLGDVAVAVNPTDNRYSHLHGNHVIHPIDGRRLPIITDDFVDKSFGTGAVKITPSHDYIDYQVGQRHKLPSLSVINTDGRMMNTTPDFINQKRFDVRWMIIKKLKELSLFVGEESHNMTIPLCSRSKDVVEPLLRDQWFVDCQDMARLASEAVENRELQILPRSYEKVWFDWLSNIRDWCISRQLWWGHQIPAYRVIFPQQPCDVWISGHCETEAKRKAGEKLGISPDIIIVQQDEDVLDTWFSSALFPFSVHGWPQMNTDFFKYYPTSLLETGNDILFFWVARMVMLGQKLTGKIPFSTVLLHGVLKDSHGRKMSKSLGNVVDPLDVIQGLSLQKLQSQISESNLDEAEIKKALASQRKEFPQGLPECGADALRFTLCSYDFKAGEISMDVTHVKSYRHFCNKIWQGYRFVVDKLGNDFTPGKSQLKLTENNSAIDIWILSQLSKMVTSCDVYIRSYDLHHATKALHTFWYSDFCDVYLECVKSVFIEGCEEEKIITQQILFTCVETFLRALSPFMPYITEELYQRLPDNGDNAVSICVAQYPCMEQYEYKNCKVDDQMIDVQIVINKMLSIRKDYNLTKTRVSTYIKVSHSEDWWNHYQSIIKILSRSESVSIVTDLSNIHEECSYMYIRDGLEIYLDMQGLFNPSIEAKRFNKIKLKLEDKLKVLEDKLASCDSKSHPETIDSLLKHQKVLLIEIEELSRKILEVEIKL